MSIQRTIQDVRGEFVVRVELVALHLYQLPRLDYVQACERL